MSEFRLGALFPTFFPPPTAVAFRIKITIICLFSFLNLILLFLDFQSSVLKSVSTKLFSHTSFIYNLQESYRTRSYSNQRKHFLHDESPLHKAIKIQVRLFNMRNSPFINSKFSPRYNNHDPKPLSRKTQGLFHVWR